MDDFQANARKMRLQSSLVVGATFGIFLTLGQAWSDFIMAIVVAIVPSHNDVVVRETYHALATSVFCTILLIALVKLDMCMTATRMRVERQELRAELSRRLPRRGKRPLATVTPPESSVVGLTAQGDARQTRAHATRPRSRQVVRQGAL